MRREVLTWSDVDELIDVLVPQLRAVGPFDAMLINKIYAASGGVPARINELAQQMLIDKTLGGKGSQGGAVQQALKLRRAEQEDGQHVAVVVLRVQLENQLHHGGAEILGVIQQKDIIACRDGQVTFRYRDSKTQQWQTRTLPGVEFLGLILRHVLPKGFRRTRNFGFLHPNSKRLIGLLQYLLGLNPNQAIAWLRKRPQLKCRCCGGTMSIVKTRIPPPFALETPMPTGS